MPIRPIQLPNHSTPKKGQFIISHSHWNRLQIQTYPLSAIAAPPSNYQSLKNEVITPYPSLNTPQNPEKTLLQQLILVFHSLLVGHESRLPHGDLFIWFLVQCDKHISAAAIHYSNELRQIPFPTCFQARSHLPNDCHTWESHLAVNRIQQSERLAIPLAYVLLRAWELCNSFVVLLTAYRYSTKAHSGWLLYPLSQWSV